MQISKQTDSVDRYIRASGFLFFLFGLLAVIFRVVQFFIMGDPPLEEFVVDEGFLILQGIPGLFAAIFFVSGASAIYLRQSNQLGLVGLIIYFFAFSALVVSSGTMWTYAFTAPVLAREAPHLLTSASSGIIKAVIGSMALGQVGWFSLAIVSLKGRIIPRWDLIVAIASIILVIIMTPVANTKLLRLIYNVLLGVGPLSIGYVLCRYRSS